jgi:hypothetical protein
MTQNAPTPSAIVSHEYSGIAFIGVTGMRSI